MCCHTKLHCGCYAVCHCAPRHHYWLQVLEWCSQAGLLHDGAGSSGRYPSRTAWQHHLQRHRQHMPGKRLFLDDLLDEVMLQGGVKGAGYPFQHALDAVAVLFSQGAADQPAWHSKLGLLLYYLLDAGYMSSTESFQLGFHLSRPLVAQWGCCYLLDSGDPSSPTNRALDAACNLLEATAHPGRWVGHMMHTTGHVCFQPPTTQLIKQTEAQSLMSFIHAMYPQLFHSRAPLYAGGCY